MSEVLARIRIRETHGIRRFLYPLSVQFTLPGTVDIAALSLASPTGEAVPLQVTPLDGGQLRLDFGVSLDPLAVQELQLTVGGPQVSVDDSLQLTQEMEKVLLWSKQERFEITLRHDGLFRDVIYDGVYFPRNLCTIMRNGRQMELTGWPIHTPTELASLSAWVSVQGRYSDDCAADTRTEITARKSWATVTHRLETPKPTDEVVFTLPLAVTAPTLTGDFGVGGGIYGKLQSETAEEIVWQTEIGNSPYARWSVATAGRMDYIGKATTAEAFLSQRWFHLIDSGKALAVAITQVPTSCRQMTVTLNVSGDVTIAFRLGENVASPAEFGVCYHFLNDIPAIAAATNPQSILLPPVVEVLPP